ncbi:hypothetical protein F7725_023171 [Dissostichus mawsoni]|uniref:PPM-type phosphatase domain-containing protein n=1 Tax=Dissostichus mawsoni TaxID=36200 RepID=A0A7J5Z0D2_DISMA|nr:hypothetical protein F7725_023171 [Dissostichus mawsoni]
MKYVLDRHLLSERVNVFVPLCVYLSRRQTASPCGGILTQSHRLDPRCSRTMLTRVKSAVANFMGGMMAGGSNGDHPGGSDLPLKYPYSRPEFLGLSPDEIECSADHIARPILILKETKRLPWATGYAEVINAGKSALNEDQACCEVLVVKRRPSGCSTPNRTSLARRRSSLPNGEGLSPRTVIVNAPLLGDVRWPRGLRGGCDGFPPPASPRGPAPSGGVGDHLHSQPAAPNVPGGGAYQSPPHPDVPARPHPGRLAARRRRGSGFTQHPPPRFFTEKKVSHESLVVGAIENAFKDMDVQIEKEKAVYNISGGCTALVVVYMLGKLYVANAGDSRAIIIRAGEVIPMSAEFTPESERQRLQFLAYMQPHLLGNEFTHLEFPRRVQKKEVGKRMLYRDFTMSGWAYKTIEDDDLKFPLIYGEGKKARVLATIGVTRGLGDHNLKVHDSNIYIKPFLSCCPEVKVYPLVECEHGADDVLVLGTDGLWDVLSNQEASEAITCFLANCDPDDQHRHVLLITQLQYTMAAQDLVMRARGVLKDRGWRISNDRLGSGDDITAYIIPLMYGNKQN